MSDVFGNHIWDPMCRLYRYPSGHVSVTEQQMYSSRDEMKYWTAVGVVCGFACLGDSYKRKGMR